jgi:hypothetical protein
MTWSPDDPDILRTLDWLSADDRRWFAARPDRSFRLRKPAPRELEMLGGSGTSHVLVRQVEPGFRMRLAVLCEGLPDCDAVLRRLWNDGAVYVPPGGRA